MARTHTHMKPLDDRYFLNYFPPRRRVNRSLPEGQPAPELLATARQYGTRCHIVSEVVGVACPALDSLPELSRGERGGD